jgi:hypothetical protein
MMLAARSAPASAKTDTTSVASSGSEASVSCRWRRRSSSRCLLAEGEPEKYERAAEQLHPVEAALIDFSSGAGRLCRRPSLPGVRSPPIATQEGR